MNSERPISAAAQQNAGNSMAAEAGSTCYVRPAPLLDVMWDQLEYLAHHRAYGCPADCMDCTRLNQVQNWLLLPFRTTVAKRKTKGR